MHAIRTIYQLYIHSWEFHETLTLTLTANPLVVLFFILLWFSKVGDSRNVSLAANFKDFRWRSVYINNPIDYTSFVLASCKLPWVPAVFSRVRRGASFRWPQAATHVQPKAEDTSGEAGNRRPRMKSLWHRGYLQIWSFVFFFLFFFFFAEVCSRSWRYFNEC